MQRALLRDEPEIVEAQQSRALPDVALGRLRGERVTRPAAVVRELDRVLEVRVEHAARVLPLDASVVHAARETEEVAGEAVAADVRRLPDGLLLDLLGERLEERPAEAGAARVVLAVRADEKERVLERLAGTREVERAQLLVRRERRAAQALLSLARRCRVGAELLPPAAVRAADEEQPRARAGVHLLAQGLLHLVGEPRRSQRVGPPQPAVLDEQPVVDAARRRAERLAVVPRHVAAEGTAATHRRPARRSLGRSAPAGPARPSTR